MNPARILVIEDEALIAMELKDHLERAGYAVDGPVALGEEALSLAATLTPDLVLMDIHLAGRLTGIETAGRLREIHDLPVVYLTAYSDPALLSQAAETAPYGYLLKPFNTRELHTTVTMALAKHRLERALHDSERRYRTLFEQAAVGVAEIEARTGGILRLNQRLGDILGPLGTLPAGIQWMTLVHPQDVTLAAGYLAALQKSWTRECAMALRLGPPDGALVWVELTLTALWAPEEEPTSYMAVVQDITARKQAEESLMRLAHQDPLTGLANRRLFQDRLTIALARAKRMGHPVGLLLLDLDRFKEVNDRFGHETGDQLLKEVAARIGAGVRQSDTVARLGGDEFALVLDPVTGPEGAAVVAAKIRDALARPFTLGETEVTVAPAWAPRHIPRTETTARHSSAGPTRWRTKPNTDVAARPERKGFLRTKPGPPRVCCPRSETRGLVAARVQPAPTRRREHSVTGCLSGWGYVDVRRSSNGKRRVSNPGLTGPVGGPGGRGVPCARSPATARA